MFTGIIEDIGRITGLSKTRLSAATRLDGIRLGDSVAVNGICLTVSSLKSGEFSFDVSEETLKRTNLGALKPGSPVNLERAMQAGGRFGGHFVTGHVETTGSIVKTLKDSKSSGMIVFSYPPEIAKYIVSKGSIAIDGISLTVVDVAEDSFSVAVIPHTLSNTTLLLKKVKDSVNLEPDILAKYNEKAASAEKPAGESSRIDLQFLKEKGFL